jgi:hypothetical protein
VLFILIFKIGYMYDKGLCLNWGGGENVTRLFIRSIRNSFRSLLQRGQIPIHDM